MNRFLACCLYLGVGAIGARADYTTAPQFMPDDGAPKPAAIIQDRAITEASGLAASKRYPGLLWVHNDSGDSARVFLIDTKGETVATVYLKGIYARDFEDISIAGVGKDAYLYVGDIGDNLSWRDSVQVHRFKEPDLDPLRFSQQIEVKTETMGFRYPGGPRNAETLLSAPDGHLWILSKDEKGSQLYSMPQAFKDGKTVTLRPLGDKMHFGAVGILTKLATGGEFSPDGQKLAIVTYAQIYEWKLKLPYDISNLKSLKPIIRTLPPLKQCESVCYSNDGRELWLSSEGKNRPLYVVPSAY